MAHILAEQHVSCLLALSAPFRLTLSNSHGQQGHRQILYETADLLEIDGQDSFRIRSYRNAAQAIENHSQQISELIADPKQVLAIPGIGKSMLRNLQELFSRRQARASQTELLEKYHPSMLQLLKIQGLGPKTIALIWSAYQVSDVDGVEKLAREGKIRELPRMGEKHEAKLLKAIEDYRRISGRFLVDAAEEEAEKMTEYLEKFPGIDKITPAGSLRRGRETVGDLDILVTGKACATEEGRQKAIAHVSEISAADGRHRQRRQQDQLPPAQRDAGGRAAVAAGIVRRGHAVLHRIESPQRGAAPARAQDGIHAERIQPGEAWRTRSAVAGKTEEEIYAKLKLDYIPPEMRENLGEIDLGAETCAAPADHAG